MGKPFSSEKRQAWVERINAQQQSGLSIEKWCKKNQTAPYVFHYWKRRLFPKSIERSSFTELIDQKNCSIDIEYQNVHIRITSPNLKQAFQALRELKC